MLFLPLIRQVIIQFSVFFHPLSGRKKWYIYIYIYILCIFVYTFFELVEGGRVREKGGGDQGYGYIFRVFEKSTDIVNF